MFRLPGFNAWTRGIGSSHFFSNSHLASLSSAKLISKSSSATSTRFLNSNVVLLKSSFLPNISHLFKSQTTSFVSRSSSGSKLGSKVFSRSLRSSTWSNYNKYYGRSNWNKLKGPALFTAAFCIGTTIVTPYLFDYTPLAYFKRNPYALVYGIIALNGAVFLMWRAPQFSRLLTRYGLLMKDNIYSNWSLLGCAFSHQNFAHILVNMFVLSSFGTTLAALVGPANFVIMYLNAAVFSSFVSLLLPTLLRSSLGVASLGASGAVFSVVGSFAYLIPKAPIAFFFIPIPGGAWLAFLGTVGWNLAGCFLRWGRYDYAAHLGGSFIGVAYGWWFTKKRRDAMQRRRLAWG